MECPPCPPLFQGRTGLEERYFACSCNWCSYKPEAKNSFSGIHHLEQGRWKVGAKAPLYFFSPPIEYLRPPSAPFQKFITTVHPTALQRWIMVTHVIRFFSSLIPSNQRTNFCNLVTKVNKIAKTVEFPGKFVYTKLLELYYDVTVKFLFILTKISAQITAKQQNIYTFF